MDILYHYCSTSSFHAIVTHSSIWLSALSLSNDTMEGKLVAAAVARLAKRDKLDPATTRRLIDSIEGLEQVAEGLGFCLSEEGDLLSQWRGYAEDATGIAIGFSSTYLKWLGRTTYERNIPSFSLRKVVYETGDQDQLVEPTYTKSKAFIEKGAFKMPWRITLLDTRTDEEVERDRKAHEQIFRELHFTLLELFPQLYLLKTYGFREEREWRLISHFVRSSKDACLYRSVPGSVIPYREFELLEGEEQPIREVVLGPRHLTPVHLVEEFLKQSGFVNVRVRRSETTYR